VPKAATGLSRTCSSPPEEARRPRGVETSAAAGLKPQRNDGSPGADTPLLGSRPGARRGSEAPPRLPRRPERPHLGWAGALELRGARDVEQHVRSTGHVLAAGARGSRGPARHWRQDADLRRRIFARASGRDLRAAASRPRRAGGRSHHTRSNGAALGHLLRIGRGDSPSPRRGCRCSCALRPSRERPGERRAPRGRRGLAGHSRRHGRRRGEQRNGARAPGGPCGSACRCRRRSARRRGALRGDPRRVIHHGVHGRGHRVRRRRASAPFGERGGLRVGRHGDHQFAVPAVRGGGPLSGPLTEEGLR
jgi:hypothetical protein